MNQLMLLSLTIFVGILVTGLLKKLRLPSVTCYLIAGVLFGPYCLGLLHIENLGFTSLAEVEEFTYATGQEAPTSMQVSLGGMPD